MAFANSAVTDIIATSIESRTEEIADNVLKNNGFYNRLRKRGNVRPVSGGSQILEELSYAENANFGFYSGYDLLPTAAADVISSPTFSFKQAACPIVISGLEQLQNAGKEQMIDLLEARERVGESTMHNNMAAAVYGDGTSYGGKSIVGLALAVSLTPTSGVYGGIDPSTSVGTFWQNQLNSAGTMTSSTIQGQMNTLWYSCIRGDDRPDLIIADNNLYGLYEQSLQVLQRFASADEGEIGFRGLKYKDATVILDGGIGGFMPTNLMYFINSKFFHFRPHKNRNMVPLSGGRRLPVNQDAELEILAWAGAVTCSGRKFHGVLKGY
jgi:hypothetical protein